MDGLCRQKWLVLDQSLQVEFRGDIGGTVRAVRAVPVSAEDRFLTSNHTPLQITKRSGSGGKRGLTDIRRILGLTTGGSVGRRGTRRRVLGTTPVLPFVSGGLRSSKDLTNTLKFST